MINHRAILCSGLAILAFVADAHAINPGPVPQWIWAEQYPNSEQTASFRKHFVLAATPKMATLEGLADDEMRVLLNGVEVVKISEQHLLEQIDVTRHLKAGPNVVAIEGLNNRGPAGVLLRLTVTSESRRREQIVTDPTWKANLHAQEGWQLANFDDRAWAYAVDFGLIGVSPWGEPIGEDEDYDQWKRSLNAGPASELTSIQVMDGFAVELVRSAAAGEGSWVSLAFDPQGRLTIAREDRGLLRMELANSGDERAPLEVINDDLLECRGLLYANNALFVNANNSKSFFSLKDTNGDSRFDEKKLLRTTEGGIGHGRNDLVLGPDNAIYLIHGNDTLLPKDYVPGASRYRNYARDRLLPCEWNRNLFNAGTVPPAGHVVRTDSTGQRWELIAGGFRNPYGIDFNADAEMFTYDADMEWDLGAPWYRPTRINHIVSGGEYGWRQGTDKWAAWYPDSLPTTLDIGKGSPTAVKFGTRGSFPAPYKDALFVLDWAYGRIFAVHLIPRGASYVAQADLLVQGRPLNVTDIDFGPDGAMYFTTGGRGTQSGLYRVRYVGAPADTLTQDTATTELVSAGKARNLRRELEGFHGIQSYKAVELAWAHLNSSDPWLRYAARVAIERQEFGKWRDRALSESRPTAAAIALMALARVGDPSLQPEVLKRLMSFDLMELTVEQRIIFLRAYQLCFIRMGQPDEAITNDVAQHLSRYFPSGRMETDRLLCELLVHLEAHNILDHALTLLEEAPTQEEQLFYLFTLRSLRKDWSLPQRRRYLAVLARANAYDGGQTIPQFVQYIRNDFLATLGSEEKSQLETEIAALYPKPPEIPPTSSARKFVKAWTMDELREIVGELQPGRDLERGRRLYSAASCGRCHRLGKEGVGVGPDLTGVARRFSARDVLESVVDPSKVIDDKYRQSSFQLTTGKVVTGTVLREDDNTISLAADPLGRTEAMEILKAEVEARSLSAVSQMPEGLLNTLTRDEVLELLAFVLASGDARHPYYRKAATSE